MTEEQIENRVEYQMSAIDRAFMAGRYTQEEYDVSVKQLNQWAEQQYRQKGVR